MLICYVRTGCPFSAKVLRAIDETGADVEIRNIGDEAIYEELLERGGKDQVPFLWGDDGDINIYESDTIVDFLHRRFGETHAL